MMKMVNLIMFYFYLMDGHTIILPISTVFDNLNHVNRIPPYVVLCTNENQNIRDSELPCNQSFQKF